MASALIPELVQPGNLFAPSNHNQFSISGAWPNTDPRMQINTAGGLFRAYQPAISGIHYPAAGTDPFSILWYGGPSYNNSPWSYSFRSAMTWMHVATASAVSGNPPPNDASQTRWGIHWTYSNSGGTIWCATAYGLYTQVAAASRATGMWYRGVTAPVNAAIRFVGGSGVSPTLHDFSLNTWANSSAATGTAGALGAITNPYFSLGPFPQTTGWSSPTVSAAAFSMGKIALFMNYYVADQELLDLLDSMNNGPPSP